MAISNPGLSQFHTLSQLEMSGPLSIPFKTAIYKSHISDRRHWIVLMGEPQRVMAYEICSSSLMVFAFAKFSFQKNVPKTAEISNNFRVRVCVFWYTGTKPKTNSRRVSRHSSALRDRHL